MKQEIIRAYDSITMPQGCEQKIRLALKEGKPGSPGLRKLALTAAVLALAMAVTACASPVVRSAAEEWIRKIDIYGIGLTIYEKEVEGTIQSVTLYDTQSPSFAQIRDGRLYFTGNGEDLDITDQITEEKPFVYTYQDESEIEVTLVVGYEGSLEEFGTYQFLRHPDGHWMTGVGRHDRNEKTGMRYAWVDRVWEELDIPWAMPEG